MRRSLRFLLLFLLLSRVACGQTCATGWAHVTATQIQNVDRQDGSTPNYVAYGTFTITPQNGSFQATNFSIPGGGIATLTPRTRSILNGGLTQTLCVPRSDLATPNVGYEITVRDTSPTGGNAAVIHLIGVAINSAEWSFDNYLITTPQPWRMFAGLAPIPTGTGYIHVTNGVVDSTAHLIDLANDTIGLLPANKISGLSSGGGSGGGGSSFYQWFQSGNSTLPQETTVSIDTSTGLWVYDDPTNGRTVFSVDTNHYIPPTNAGRCVLEGDGHCYTLHPSDLTPDFAYAGFGCTNLSTVEIGGAFGTPTCTVSYTGGLPTSGSVSDTQSHTVTLTAPNYSTAVMPTPTALTSAGSVCYSATVSTLGTSGSACDYATYMTYAGAGTGTFTGSTATVSGASLPLTGITGTLSAAGLNNQGSYTISMSNQNGIVVAQGCNHTFYQDSGHVTQIVMQTPVALTVTNANGIPVSGYCAFTTANPLNIANQTFYMQ